LRERQSCFNGQSKVSYKSRIKLVERRHGRKYELACSKGYKQIEKKLPISALRNIVRV
jgi:hypothetical protein